MFSRDLPQPLPRLRELYVGSEVLIQKGDGLIFVELKP
jgi:hypothetical protein